MSRELIDVSRIVRRLEGTETRTGLFAVGRSSLALSQLCILVFNSNGILFGSPEGPREGCTGVASASLWCVFGGSNASLNVARVIAVVVLGIVTAGYRPAWSCVPHWYVSVSMSTSITAANGGEYVAQAATLLLIPACLGDSRRWHWTRAEASLSPRWVGQSSAAHFVLRCQVAVIYGEAAVSKLANPAWRDGRALAAIFADPLFGLPRFVDAATRTVTSSVPAMMVLGWGIISGEILVAMLLLGPARFRRAAALLIVILHSGIIVLMGLLPFGVIMCAVGALAVSEQQGEQGRSLCTWKSPTSMRTVRDALTSRATSTSSPPPRRSTVQTHFSRTSKR